MHPLSAAAVDGYPRTPRPVPQASNIQILNLDTVIKEFTVLEPLGTIRSVDATKEGVVWVGGFNGKVGKSTDFGRTWEVFEPAQDESKTQLQFRGIAILEDGVVCAMAAGESEKGHSRVYRTNNGGETWALVLFPLEPGFFFDAIRFWDKNNGLILGDPRGGDFVVYKTADGGQSWEKIESKTLAAFPKEVIFAASNTSLTVQGSSHAWFCTGGAQHSRVFCSKDQGRTWEASLTPMENKSGFSGLFSIAFKNENEGIAVGGDCIEKTGLTTSNIYVTFDGGSNWSVPAHSNPAIKGNYLSCVAWTTDSKCVPIDGSKDNFHAVAFRGNKGYAVGNNGSVALLET